MHEFLVRIRAQLLWAWARLDEAEASARSGIEVLSLISTATASVPGNVDSMLAGPW